MPTSNASDELLASLHDRVAEQAASWRPSGSVTDVRPLTGGASSLTFLVDIAGVPDDEATVVLKVAPPGLEPVRNRDVLRQARLLSALGGRGLAPDLLFSDAGAPPRTPPFLAMKLVAGDCLEPVLLARADRPPPPVVRSRYLEAARLLARLHGIAPGEVGLGDQPVVALEEEIERWTRTFATLPDSLRGDYETVAGTLRNTVPEAVAPVINHGDYRLGNTLCEGDRVNAIIDWEIWSVGDPRVDVAWFCFFADDGGHPAVDPSGPAGTPTSDEIRREYESALGWPVRDLEWFQALTKYKEAALTGLLFKRANKAGRSVSPAMERMRPALSLLLDQALQLIG